MDSVSPVSGASTMGRDLPLIYDTGLTDLPVCIVTSSLFMSARVLV